MADPTLAELAALDRALTPAERRVLFQTRPGENAGYAAPPGTGPAGETCGSCVHIVRTGRSSKRAYPKCGLLRAAWTRGPGTDIKVRAPACARWAAPADGASPSS